jgi:beta-lactamase regulating signal transducer with metallopeptidase domain
MTEFLTALAFIFRQMLSMSLTALPVMAVVLITRLVLGRVGAPRKAACALWSVVAFRLFCPVTFRTPWNLFHLKTMSPLTIPITGGLISADDGGFFAGATPTAPAGSLASGATDALPLSAGEITLRICAILWLAGAAVLVLRSLLAYFRLKRRLADAVRQEDGVYEHDGLSTPFVLGFLRPRIYLPRNMDDSQRACVLCHERTHIRRGDLWWKLLGFCILVAYWWNPFVWLCWFLFTRDLEMSCDEAVLARLGSGAKRGYSLSLVDFAAGHRFPAATPLAFGEGDARSRVKHVLNWKRGTPRLAFLAFGLAVVLVFLCCTNAVPRGSWVQCRNGSFTYSYSSGMNSMALYQEIYQRGTLVSRNLLIQGNLTPRSGSFAVKLVPQLNPDGSWNSFDWNWTDETGTVTILPSNLPGTDVGTGLATSMPEGIAQKQELTDGAGVILAVESFDISGDGASSYPIGGTDAERQTALNSADRTVMLYLVVSSAKADSLAENIGCVSQLARSLYQHKNDVDALLSTLGTETTLGHCIWTNSANATLSMTFYDCPANPSVRNTTIWKYSMILLALLNHCHQTSWNWDGDGTAAPGKSGGLWDTESWLTARGMDANIHVYGTSVMQVQLLLNALYPNCEGAETLYALRNLYTGDAAADSALLEALDVQNELGDYTLELFTAEKPYAMQINLTENAGDTGKNQSLFRNSCALLALIDNLSEVRWHYPDPVDGSVTYSLSTHQANETLAAANLPDVKTCGESLEGLQALLNMARADS